MSHTDPFTRLYQRPGFLLRRAHRISVAIFERECAELNLTPAQFGVLYILQHAPGIDQSTLSRALGLDRVTILHVAKGLEQRGLLIRRSTPPKRRLSLELTQEGQRAFERAQPLAERAIDRLYSPLSPNEQSTLTHLLNKLCDGLEPEARAEMMPPRSPDA